MIRYGNDASDKIKLNDCLIKFKCNFFIVTVVEDTRVKNLLCYFINHNDQIVFGWVNYVIERERLNVIDEKNLRNKILGEIKKIIQVKKNNIAQCHGLIGTLRLLNCNYLLNLKNCSLLCGG